MGKASVKAQKARTSIAYLENESILVKYDLLRIKWKEVGLEKVARDQAVKSLH